VTIEPSALLQQRRSQHETRLQIFLVQTFRKHIQPHHAILAMVANGGHRSADTVALLGRMGLVRGWPDLALVTHRARCRWIEVKLERTLQHDRTTLYDDQKEIHDTLAWMDHPVDVVRNLKELWAIVNQEEIPHTLKRWPAEQSTFDFRKRKPKPRKAASEELEPLWTS
jgi:hypothetical protein